MHSYYNIDEIVPPCEIEVKEMLSFWWSDTKGHICMKTLTVQKLNKAWHLHLAVWC